MTNSKTVLIAGASGLVGTAAANSFIRAGWQVIACSRRYPDLIDAGPFTHIPLDLQDREACELAARHLGEVTHIVYTAVFELPGLVMGWADPQQIATNGEMIRNLIDPVASLGKLEHVTVLQGTKAYGITQGPIRIPARESQPRVTHPNFYWVQEDYIREKSAACGFGFTVFRPQLIVGPNHGVVMNLPPVIGIYAALRREEGLPFGFPGSIDSVWEAVDARLVGNACLWAATHPHSHGETYNLTNGEVFSWLDMWPAMARALGMQAGNPEPVSLATYLPERESLWQDIQLKYQLRPVPLDQLLGESHFYADLCFAYGAKRTPNPTFVSTVKIRQAGFNEVHNTEESFCFWLNDLQQRKIIPG
ncbi:MAG: SDR family oxidoreductase [Pseudomonadales bacterium]|nr:SDR family oxidoreductase [Pseudomonadales bacterium]